MSSRPLPIWYFLTPSLRDTSGTNKDVRVDDLCFVRSLRRFFWCSAVTATTSTWVEYTVDDPTLSDVLAAGNTAGSNGIAMTAPQEFALGDDWTLRQNTDAAKMLQLRSNGQQIIDIEGSGDPENITLRGRMIRMFTNRRWIGRHLRQTTNANTLNVNILTLAANRQAFGQIKVVGQRSDTPSSGAGITTFYDVHFVRTSSSTNAFTQQSVVRLPTGSSPPTITVSLQSTGTIRVALKGRSSQTWHWKLHTDLLIDAVDGTDVAP